jgi:hypothetical protein
MNKETDYCLARSKEDIKNFCKKFAEFDCQGCPFSMRNSLIWMNMKSSACRIKKEVIKFKVTHYYYILNILAQH